MQSRILVNLGLFIFLASLSAFMFFETSSSDEDKKKRITTLDKNSVNKITIPRKANDIILIRKDGEWFMQSPHSMRAHPFRINSLLNLVELKTESHYSVDNLDIKEFSLDKPRAKIIFNSTLIEFGKANPVNHKRYLKVDNKIFLVDDSLYPLISSQPTSFVDLALFSETDKIKKLILPDLKLIKDTNEKWIAEPEGTTDADSIQNLLQSWEFAKAFGVHAYMPRKNLGKINITLESNKLISFEITDKKPWLILARPELGIEYHLDISNNKNLLYITEQVDN
jgi:hypothetical protein